MIYILISKLNLATRKQKITWGYHLNRVTIKPNETCTIERKAWKIKVKCWTVKLKYIIEENCERIWNIYFEHSEQVRMYNYMEFIDHLYDNLLHKI